MSPDTLSLAGKVALVTGSGKENGIGAAIARAFARNGASVAIHYVSDGSKARAEKTAAAIAKEFGTKTTVVQGSVASSDAARSIVEQTKKGLGADHIDILINNAGDAASTQNVMEVTKEHLDYDFGVNVYGVVYMTQAVVGLGKMPHGGRIINIGTIASRISNPGTSLYNAAKLAQDSLTAGFASALGRTHGITVNSLAPGAIPTDTSKRFLTNDDGTTNQFGQAMAAQARAANRLGTPEDVADAALLLVSEKSRWITAQWISLTSEVRDMTDIQEGVQPTTSESNSRYCCALCKKTFAQEATAKRHYYYCRSKPADTKESRRRSCDACVRAKARCIWPADNSIDACIRCNKRNVACEYDTAATRRNMRNQASKDTVSATDPVTPVQEGPNADIPETSTALVSIIRGSSPNETTVFDPSNESYLYLENATELAFLNNLDVELAPYQGISSMSLVCLKLVQLSTALSTPPTPWTYQPSNTSLFTTRAFTRPDHVVLVSLAMRVLRSYPSMMITKGSLPPFINSTSYSWAQSGGDHKLHKKTAGKTNWIWGLIWNEQERIMTQDVPVGHAVFDVSLLTTANLVSQALGVSVGQKFDCSISEDPTLAWSDWIFLESRRRTVLIFQILGLLVDMSTAVSYFAIAGLVLVPLPSAAVLWSTQDFEKWKPEYRKWRDQRVAYGLSETGDLVKLQNTEDGILSTLEEWEGWSAEVGDPGPLVMMIAELLKNQ
ncbi:hypothetical protein CHU98_g8136 [Xylaria longipes]|nr:hypothetical protein CHU98_g8136 [Xylaria longipes]